MSIKMDNDERIPEKIPSDTDARNESVASQEEIYLETTEETLRAFLISQDPSAYLQQETACVDCCSIADSPDEELPTTPGDNL